MSGVDLIVNGVGTVRTSLGGRRYYEGIMAHLNWPGKVEVTPLPRWRVFERATELAQRGRRDAIFWSPNHRGPLRAHNHVVTVLDCINVEYTYRGDWRLPLYRRLIQSLLGRAVAVVTISHATRDAVLRNYRIPPDRIVVIPGPVRFGELWPQVTRDAPVAQPFILMITNTLPHKNTAAAGRALAASRAAREGIVLRVIGSMEKTGLEACRKAGLQVEFHKGISDELLAQWMRQSRFVFSPSLDEGLNLPVAEALAQRANVLCSDVAVHREFYDGEALFCNPHDVEAMRQGIDDALGRSCAWHLDQARQAKPTFADVAQQYRALFQRLGQVAAAR
jgi:glycosyltransferase involved in cell wall biosynthesis